MAEAHKSHTKEYIVIFVLLTVLTVVEIYVPEWNASYAVRAWSLTALALAKAWLVAYYFMHLKEESKWMKFIAAIPISAAIYAGALMLESMYR